MEGEGETPNVVEMLRTILDSPMLKFDPNKYFERAALVFVQFSEMSSRINANHALLKKVLLELEKANHLLRKVQKKL